MPSAHALCRALPGALLLALCPLGAHADASLTAPLYVTNLSPVAGILGLPAQREAEVAEPGEWQWALHGALASHYVADSHSGEQLTFDGETYRLLLEARYAFAPGWELQLDLPWLRQNGGFMDSAIDSWHDFWGLPENGRDRAPRHRLYYHYADAGASPALRLQSRGGSSGLGEAKLSVQYQLYQREGLTLAALAGYKLGSGDRDDFTGSGEGDAYTGLRLSAAVGDTFTWHGQAGYLRSGDITGLEYRQEKNLWYAGAGLSWQFDPRWALMGQLDAHRAPLDSGLDALGESAVMLSGGLRWQLASQWLVDFFLVEDIAVETAPDVTFQAGVRYLSER